MEPSHLTTLQVPWGSRLLSHPQLVKAKSDLACRWLPPAEGKVFLCKIWPHNGHSIHVMLLPPHSFWCLSQDLSSPWQRMMGRKSNVESRQQRGWRGLGQKVRGFPVGKGTFIGHPRVRLEMVAARCSCGCAGTKNDHLQVRGQQWGSPDHAWTPLVGGGGAYIGSTSLALTGMGLGRADVELVEAKLVEGS